MNDPSTPLRIRGGKESFNGVMDEVAIWDLVEVDGVFDIPAAPPSNMHTLARPDDPVRFYRLEEFPAPPVIKLSENFDPDAGEFIAVNHTAPGTIWTLGNPASTDEGGIVDSDNSGSGNCWGTDISDPGFYATGTDTSLISPVIDLSAVAEASLSFAQAIDVFDDDTLVVNVIEADISGGITVIGSPIHTTTPDTNINNAAWEMVSSVAIAGGQAVRIEWRFTGSNDTTTPYIGAYIDDVLVTVP